MHHVLLVRVTQRFSHPGHDGQHGGDGKQLVLLAGIHQVFALEELHGDVGQVVLFTGIKYGDDVLMLQSPGRLRLPEKPVAGVSQLVTLKFFVQGHGFDRHHASDLGILSKEHFPHRTFAQLFFDLVAPQHGFFHGAIRQKNGPARMRAAPAQHDGLGQAFGPAELDFDVFVVRVESRHMLVHGFRLVELPLGFKIKRQTVKIAHHRLAQGKPAKPVKCRVELVLALQSKPHHAAGLCGLFV